MTGEEFHELRKQSGFNIPDFMLELGYSGPETNLKTHYQRLKTGKRDIPLSVARLAWLMVQVLLENDVPQSGSIDWPKGLEDAC